MPYCTQKEFIFIHIPKTGGTGIESKLNLGHEENGFIIKDNIAYQHSNYQYYKNLLGEENFNKFLKFSVVRNPYTRIISDYFFIPVNNVAFKGGKSFNEFLLLVKDIVEQDKFLDNLYFDHFKPQHSFICNSDNKLMIDKLFYFEKFNEIENFLFKNFRITDKQIILKGNYKKDQIILTNEQKKIIYNLYKKDFDIFGYNR